MDERRRFRRIGADLIIMYVVQGDEATGYKPIRSVSTPQTVDVSMGGIKISNDEFLPKDTQLKIILSIPSSKDTIEVMAKVVWTKRVAPPSSFETGIEFSHFVTDNSASLNNYIETR